MTGPVDPAVAVADLLAAARQAYTGDETACAALDEARRRVDEPLRVAVAGKVKSGKSTLLNALIGEEIAPTDAGECTRVVTWYRHGRVPLAVLHPVDGPPRELALHREHGRLALRLDCRAEDVERLEISWPARGLRRMTLIDTPGLASVSGDTSARTVRFLTPDSSVSESDAVVYLLRHLHATDTRFLEAFRDTAAGGAGTVNTLAVLARADEVGSGRIDAMLSAGTVAARYREDRTLRSLCLTVVPVAGLLASSARTLRQREHDALVALARLERSERERLLLSADRFRAPSPVAGLAAEERAALLDRFGVYGIRLAVSLLRGGVRDVADLARELERRSGLDELAHLLQVQFQERSAPLRHRTALLAVERLLADRPPPASSVAQLSERLERIRAGSHELRELALLARTRTSTTAVPPGTAPEAERLLGGSGCEPWSRLGLPQDAVVGQLAAAALDAARRWRVLADSPANDRAITQACEVLVRTAEGIAHHLGPVPVPVSAARGPRVQPAQPAAGGGPERRHQPDQGQRGGGQQRHGAHRGAGPADQDVEQPGGHRRAHGARHRQPPARTAASGAQRGDQQ